jgi:hypothetical protein
MIQDRGARLLSRRLKLPPPPASAHDPIRSAAGRRALPRSDAKRRPRPKSEAAERFAIDDLKSQATAEQKEDLKRSEVSLAHIQSAMKRGKLSPLSCRAEDVAKLAFCIGDGKSHSACAQPELARKIVAERELIAAVQLTPSEPPLTPAQQKEKVEEDDTSLLRPEF